MLEGAKLHSQMEKEAFLRPMMSALRRGYRSLVPISKSKALEIDKLNTQLLAQRNARIASKLPSKLNPLSYGGLKGAAITGIGGYAGLRGAMHAGILDPTKVRGAVNFIRNKSIELNPEYWGLRNIRPYVSRSAESSLGLSPERLRQAFVQGGPEGLDITKRVNTSFWDGALTKPDGGILEGFGEYAGTLGSAAGSAAALPSSLALKGLGAVAPGAAATLKGGLASLAATPYLGVAAPLGMSLAGIYGLKKAVGLGSKLISRAGRARRLRMLRAGYAPSGYSPELINYYNLR